MFFHFYKFLICKKISEDNCRSNILAERFEFDFFFSINLVKDYTLVDESNCILDEKLSIFKRS